MLIKRSLHVTKAPHKDSQREIFSSRCIIREKPCVLIINCGSSTNLAFKILIDKLQIPAKEQPNLYSLQWLGLNNKATISRKAVISFSTGLYCGKLLCDVHCTDACHLLVITW